MERKQKPTRIDVITSTIDAALADSEASGVTDLLGIQDEVWAVLDAGVEAGHYTMDEALCRYRSWHNTYALGSLASRGLEPEGVIALPTHPAQIMGLRLLK